MSGKDDAEKIVRQLSDYVNNMSHDSEAFANAVMQEHRTLQQSMMALFVLCIKKWSECDSENNHDGRNEATCKMATKIMEALDGDIGLPFI